MTYDLAHFHATLQQHYAGLMGDEGNPIAKSSFKYHEAHSIPADSFKRLRSGNYLLQETDGKGDGKEEKENVWSRQHRPD